MSRRNQPRRQISARKERRRIVKFNVWFDGVLVGAGWV